MKYKVGDKVKIKTWEKMKEEFEEDDGYIECYLTFTSDMEQFLLKLNNGRVLTVKKIDYDPDNYIMEESPEWMWSDDMIEGLYADAKEGIEEISRFDLMEM